MTLRILKNILTNINFKVYTYYVYVVNTVSYIFHLKVQRSDLCANEEDISSLSPLTILNYYDSG